MFKKPNQIQILKKKIGWKYRVWKSDSFKVEKKFSFCSDGSWDGKKSSKKQTKHAAAFKQICYQNRMVGSDNIRFEQVNGIFRRILGKTYIKKLNFDKKFDKKLNFNKKIKF